MECGWVGENEARLLRPFIEMPSCTIFRHNVRYSNLNNNTLLSTTRICFVLCFRTKIIAFDSKWRTYTTKPTCVWHTYTPSERMWLQSGTFFCFFFLILSLFRFWLCDESHFHNEKLVVWLIEGVSLSERRSFAVHEISEHFSSTFYSF